MKNPQAFPSEERVTTEKKANKEIPFKHFETVDIKHQGMTLLDYFAGQALKNFTVEYSNNSFTIEMKNNAQHCYNIAEAMLEEREKRI